MWQVFDQLIANSRLTQDMRDRVRAVGHTLFHDRFGVDERTMLTAAVTAANLDGYADCASALIEFAEGRGIDNNFLKALIDAMPDATEFTKGEQAVIKLSTEITRRTAPRRATLRFASDYFTPAELEFLVVLTGFVNFLARLQAIESLAEG